MNWLTWHQILMSLKAWVQVKSWVTDVTVQVKLKLFWFCQVESSDATKFVTRVLSPSDVTRVHLRGISSVCQSSYEQCVTDISDKTIQQSGSSCNGLYVICMFILINYTVEMLIQFQIKTLNSNNFNIKLQSLNSEIWTVLLIVLSHSCTVWSISC